MARKIVVVLKGYPRLSETFIAQEILGLERSGLDLVLMSLRHPTDGRSHPVHDEIQAPIRYLPEYLHDEPRRVARALWRALRLPGFFSALMKFLADYARDRTRNRIRRFGQAAALAVEFPADAQWLHAHFIHTPASVTSYASLMLNIPWSCSAHAKDIWTSPDWELKAKIASARWLVTCTKTGLEKLWSLAADKDKLHLSYHGLDLSRFAPFAGDRPPRDGSNPEDPVILLSVGRAVAKKGYDILLAALALLPPEFAWRFVHIGGGDQIPALKEKAQSLELAHRIDWHGAQALSRGRPLRARQPDCRGRRSRRAPQCARRGRKPGLGLRVDIAFRHCRTPDQRRERPACRAGESRRTGRCVRSRHPRASTPPEIGRCGRKAGPLRF
jgi:glycosyltransferase involved in cell wall biosynthesis